MRCDKRITNKLTLMEAAIAMLAKVATERRLVICILDSGNVQIDRCLMFKVVGLLKY